MDVQMPGMDGLEATAIIRHGELTSGAHVPIVALTPTPCVATANAVCSPAWIRI